MKLRYLIKKWFERKHFSIVGQNVILHWSVGLNGNKSIRLENNVKILRGVSVEGTVWLGNNTIIRDYSILSGHNGSIKIGQDCAVNPFCVLYGHGGLIIGNNVRIAAQTLIIPANHIYTDAESPISQQGISAKGVTIEDDVWIGAGVKILDGTKIGRGSVIGAGAVVRGEIPPYSVAVGVPAKIIKKRK